MNAVSVLVARVTRKVFWNIPKINSPQSGNMMFYQSCRKDEVKVGQKR
jgi:hypothetical protein